MENEVTADFREAFHLQRDNWLRRRYVYYATVMTAISLFSLLINLLVSFVFDELIQPYLGEADAAAFELYTHWLYMLVSMGLLVLISAIYVSTAWYVAAKKPDRWVVLRIVYWIFIVVQMSNTVSKLIQSLLVGQDMVAQQLFRTTITGLAISHIIVCAFIPWSPREALRPIVPVIVFVSLLILVFSPRAPWQRVAMLLPIAATCLPGLLICAWRDRHFRRHFDHRMLKNAFVSMRHEMDLARRIHDQCFPPPISQGPVTFDYAYRPAKQLGGDFLTVFRQNNRLGLLIVDVTGHGIAAALAVNRLLGEVGRLLSVGHANDPGAILAGLNAYMHANYSDHSVFATALAVSVAPDTDRLYWASAGHLPAFHISPHRHISTLDSTTTVLGALPHEDFIADTQSIEFPHGSTLLVYTDGAIEARPRNGKMLSINGLQSIVESVITASDQPYTKRILDQVDRYRSGNVEDDTLIAELTHREVI